MEPPRDGIVYSNPVLGQPLFVKDSKGNMVNCGQVTGCEYRVVMRGETGSVVHATMVFVQTTVFSEGFLVYPDKDVPVPESFQATVQRVD